MSVSVLVPTTGPWGEVAGYAALADELGYNSINCSHISARDSFTTLAALASVAPSVRLATAVAPIYHRSPASMAQTAATVDDVSGGRFRLGLGTGHRITMAQWHGAEIGRPLAEMREYVGVVRALWSGHIATEGARWRSEFEFVDFAPRQGIPIYLAALSRGMIRLAAEIADGIVLWACPPSYIRDVVVPEIREVRRVAGLGLAAFDAAAGDRTAQLDAISERFVFDLCAIGDSPTISQVLQRYRHAGAVNPMITQIWVAIIHERRWPSHRVRPGILVRSTNGAQMNLNE